MSGHGTTDQDARALVHLARRLRDETHGCKQWDEGGTWAVFRDELIGQNLALSIERVLCHATDPEAKTPGAIKRPFTPPKPSEQPKRGGPPKAHSADECRRHPGQWATGCATCATEDIRAAYDDAPPSPDLPPVADVSPRLAARLAALQPATGEEEA